MQMAFLPKSPQVTKMGNKSRGGDSGENRELVQGGQAGQAVLLALAWGCWWKKWVWKKAAPLWFPYVFVSQVIGSQGGEKMRIRVVESPKPSRIISSWGVMSISSSSTHNLSASWPLSSNDLTKEIWTQRQKKQSSFDCWTSRNSGKKIWEGKRR